MLHVDPSTLVSTPSTFDPIAYLAYSRSCGVPVHARMTSDGKRQLLWDVSNITCDQDDASPYERDVHTNPANQLAVWQVLRAEAYIAGARECGLVVFPWPVSCDIKDGVCMGETGQEDDGPNDYGAATARFLKHPAIYYRADLPPGMLGKVICADFGLDPTDPQLHLKVNARMRAEREERERAFASRKTSKRSRRRPPRTETGQPAHH